ncbi:hypothetical protein PR048_016855 [Dryococelus australis]|uniref:Uncharacterized protein n=1 Tax=Dryococelus australis TaxID=614101 RepID=A0ABQ9H818_9NEOP|nr:hypothetical protein PR048_016855 [Dryococelus australis]
MSCQYSQQPCLGAAIFREDVPRQATFQSTVRLPSYFDWLKHVLVRGNCLRTNHGSSVSELRDCEWLGQMRPRHHQPIKCCHVEGCGLLHEVAMAQPFKTWVIYIIEVAEEIDIMICTTQSRKWRGGGWVAATHPLAASCVDVAAACGIVLIKLAAPALPGAVPTAHDSAAGRRHRLSAPLVILEPAHERQPSRYQSMEWKPRHESEGDNERQGQGYKDIWAALNSEVLRAGEVIEVSVEQHRNERAGETGKFPEKKTRRPAASSGTITICENPGVSRPGIEPDSPWWEASSLTAQTLRSRESTILSYHRTQHGSGHEEGPLALTVAGNKLVTTAYRKRSIFCVLHINTGCLIGNEFSKLRDDAILVYFANIRQMENGHGFTGKVECPRSHFLSESVFEKCNRYRDVHFECPGCLSGAWTHSSTSVAEERLTEGFFFELSYGILLRFRANPLRLQGKEVMQGIMHRGREGLGSNGQRLGSLTTSLSVPIVKTITKKILGKNRQRQRWNSWFITKDERLVEIRCCIWASSSGGGLAERWRISPFIAHASPQRPITQFRILLGKICATVEENAPSPCVEAKSAAMHGDKSYKVICLSKNVTCGGKTADYVTFGGGKIGHSHGRDVRDGSRMVRSYRFLKSCELQPQFENFVYECSSSLAPPPPPGWRLMCCDSTGWHQNNQAAGSNYTLVLHVHLTVGETALPRGQLLHSSGARASDLSIVIAETALSGNCSLSHAKRELIGRQWDTRRKHCFSLSRSMTVHIVCLPRDRARSTHSAQSYRNEVVHRIRKLALDSLVLNQSSPMVVDKTIEDWSRLLSGPGNHCVLEKRAYRSQAFHRLTLFSVFRNTAQGIDKTRLALDDSLRFARPFDISNLRGYFCPRIGENLPLYDIPTLCEFTPNVLWFDEEKINDSQTADKNSIEQRMALMNVSVGRMHRSNNSSWYPSWWEASSLATTPPSPQHSRGRCLLFSPLYYDLTGRELHNQHVCNRGVVCLSIAMLYFTDEGQTVGARLVHAFVTTVDNLLGVLRDALSSVLTAYRNRRFVYFKKKIAGTKVTAELNIRLENTVPTKTARWEVHKQNSKSTADTANLSTPGEAYNPDCLLPTVKHEGSSVEVSAVASWFSVRRTVKVNVNVYYETLLGGRVNSVAQGLFTAGDGILEDDNAPTHAAANFQSLWPAFKNKLRVSYPPPASLTELRQILFDERYNIPLTTNQDLYASHPRRMQAILDAKCVRRISPRRTANSVQSPAGSLRIFSSGNRSGMMPLVGGFSRDPPLPPFHSGAAPYSPLTSPSSALMTSLKYLPSLTRAQLALQVSNEVGPIITHLKKSPKASIYTVVPTITPEIIGQTIDRFRFLVVAPQDGEELSPKEPENFHMNTTSLLQALIPSFCDHAGLSPTFTDLATDTAYMTRTFPFLSKPVVIKQVIFSEKSLYVPQVDLKEFCDLFLFKVIDMGSRLWVKIKASWIQFCGRVKSYMNSSDALTPEAITACPPNPITDILRSRKRYNDFQGADMNKILKSRTLPFVLPEALFMYAVLVAVAAAICATKSRYFCYCSPRYSRNIETSKLGKKWAAKIKLQRSKSLEGGDSEKYFAFTQIDRVDVWVSRCFAINFRRPVESNVTFCVASEVNSRAGAEKRDVIYHGLASFPALFATALRLPSQTASRQKQRWRTETGPRTGENIASLRHYKTSTVLLVNRKLILGTRAPDCVHSTSSSVGVGFVTSRTAPPWEIPRLISVTVVLPTIDRHARNYENINVPVVHWVFGRNGEITFLRERWFIRKLRVESALFVPVARNQREYGDFPYFVFTDLTPFFVITYCLSAYALYRSVRHSVNIRKILTVRTHNREEPGSNPVPAILISVFLGFPKSLQANAGMGTNKGHGRFLLNPSPIPLPSATCTVSNELAVDETLSTIYLPIYKQDFRLSLVRWGSPCIAHSGTSAANARLHYRGSKLDHTSPSDRISYNGKYRSREKNGSLGVFYWLEMWGRGGAGARLLASHLAEPESCRVMALVSGYYLGSLVSPALSFGRCFVYSPHFTFIRSQDLDVKSPNLFAHWWLEMARAHPQIITCSYVATLEGLKIFIY